MNSNGKAAIVASVTVLAAVPSSAQQPTTGPIATYWVSAATSSGFGAGLMGATGRPSVGAALGMLRGGGQGANRTLLLQLASTQKPPAPPSAEHVPPPGLGAGATLPLLTPAAPREVKATAEDPDPLPMQRPKGRLLIFWGCGEHAPTGQPFVLDFSTLGAGSPIPRLPQMIDVRAQRPPSPTAATTYGLWPNEKTRQQIPASGSLVGPHLVRGDYTPDIHFTLAPGQDFMPALQLTSNSKTPAGATRLTWSPVAGATGYFAMLVGGGAGPEAEGATAVMWSSSAAPTMGGALLDYLAPAEVARLIEARAVMAPRISECIVPLEVTQAAKTGLVQMIAYGDQADFTDPPRPTTPRTPWNINYAVKVRFKSTTNAVLGLSMPNADAPPQTAQNEGRSSPAAAQSPPPSAAPPTAADRAKSVLRGLGGLGRLAPGLP